MFEEQELTEEDYNSVVELVFKPEGNRDPPFPTPPHKLAFPFKFKVDCIRYVSFLPFLFCISCFFFFFFSTSFSVV
jgi:hypothetical protein